MKTSTNLITVNEGQDFTFTRDAAKLIAFSEWFQQAIDEEILRIDSGGTVSDHWLNTYVGNAYIRGSIKTRSQVEKALGDRLNRIEDYSPFRNQAHVDRAELIFQRTFEDLKGVTSTMADQTRRVLSQGILEGKNPNVVAREMVERVDKIGITRAKLIARTEIVESHNSASIMEAELLTAETGEDIQMRWKTSIDGRERDTHHDRHNNIYPLGVAQSLIGEPNCRCSITAVVDLDAEIARAEARLAASNTPN